MTSHQKYPGELQGEKISKLQVPSSSPVAVLKDLHALKRTAKAPDNRLRAPKGNETIPTIRFQVLLQGGYSPTVRNIRVKAWQSFNCWGEKQTHKTFDHVTSTDRSLGLQTKIGDKMWQSYDTLYQDIHGIWEDKSPQCWFHLKVHLNMCIIWC